MLRCSVLCTVSSGLELWPGTTKQAANNASHRYRLSTIYWLDPNQPETHLIGDRAGPSTTTPYASSTASPDSDKPNKHAVRREANAGQLLGHSSARALVPSTNLGSRLHGRNNSKLSLLVL